MTTGLLVRKHWTNQYVPGTLPLAHRTYYYGDRESRRVFLLRASVKPWTLDPGTGHASLSRVPGLYQQMSSSVGVVQYAIVCSVIQIEGEMHEDEGVVCYQSEISLGSVVRARIFTELLADLLGVRSS